MAAPTFNTANTGATDAGGVWSFGWGSLQGGPIIVQILQDGSTDGAVTFTGNNGINNLAGSAGWTAIAGPNGDGSWPVGASGEARQFLFIGRGTGAASPTISGGNSTSEDLYCRMYAFNNVSTGTTLATVIEPAVASIVNSTGTSNTASDASVTTAGPDRLALNFVAVNDDNAISAFTGETGGDWTLAVTPYADAGGTDGAIGLQISPIWVLSQATGGTPVGVAGAAGTRYRAQSFQQAGIVSAIQVLAGLIQGNPSDDMILELRTDASGVPSTTVLATATVTDANWAASTWINFPFAPVTLAAATTYWIVIYSSAASDGGLNFRYWDGATDVYASNGNCYSADGISWTTPATSANDLTFRIVSAGTIDGGTGSIVDSDAWGVVGFALIGTTVVLDQQHYRFRNDDGNETTATWLADLDTDVN